MHSHILCPQQAICALSATTPINITPSSHQTWYTPHTRTHIMRQRTRALDGHLHNILTCSVDLRSSHTTLKFCVFPFTSTPPHSLTHIHSLAHVLLLPHETPLSSASRTSSFTNTRTHTLSHSCTRTMHTLTLDHAHFIRSTSTHTQRAPHGPTRAHVRAR